MMMMMMMMLLMLMAGMSSAPPTRKATMRRTHPHRRAVGWPGKQAEASGSRRTRHVHDARGLLGLWIGLIGAERARFTLVRRPGCRTTGCRQVTQNRAAATAGLALRCRP
ncbi:hypothetical protein POJ06DRAFT_243461 [Lipomyces tetrasporus]|uniref:Secreted protein n=1 Tax=Lipomyces tetrasporus TaxID=54092 RepID=A0AAD7QZ64_9ASCO|nr:uncharacterized protein POJ06DRAFT_243461 [Lipomyces tetrasporus]KAJ8104070.1 hypothetical protein POJ06DRAFT_243461 [Lipomyces tetrasporus]